MTVYYDDGDTEKLLLKNEYWRFETSSVHSNTPSDIYAITDKKTSEIQRILLLFSNKIFMKLHAQGFEQFTVSKSYDAEE